jgi:hypothetical protein
MALENVDFVTELVQANPPGTDVIAEGDNHIRLIKKVLKLSFPDVDQQSATIIVKTTAPSTQIKGTIWYDTTTNLLKINTADDAATASWVTVNAGAPWAAGTFGGSAVGYRSFSATKGGSNQGSIASGTLTKVTWPTAEWDTGGCFAEGSDPDVSVATSRFICNLAGKYHFYFALKLTGNVLYDNAVWLYKNGSAWRYANYFIAYDSGANTGVPTMQMEATLDLADTDYIEVMVHQESGGAQTVDGATTASWFTGYRIE